jgi:hypothetical protein
MERMKESGRGSAMRNGNDEMQIIDGRRTIPNTRNQSKKAGRLPRAGEKSDGLEGSSIQEKRNELILAGLGKSGPTRFDRNRWETNVFSVKQAYNVKKIGLKDVKC